MTVLKDTLASEVLNSYQRYLDAFMADDMDALNALVSYPLAYIGEGSVKMLNEFPIRPSTLRAQTGWHETVNTKYEVVGITERKAHLVLKSGTRVRQDGSAIEEICAFYAWTKTAEGWKIFALSGISVPA